MLAFARCTTFICKLLEIRIYIYIYIRIYIYIQISALYWCKLTSRKVSLDVVSLGKNWRSTVYHFLVTQFWSHFFLKMFNKLNGFKNKNQTEVYTKVASSEKRELFAIKFFSRNKLLGACFASKKTRENWLAEKQFIHQFHQVFLGFRWIYTTICGWHVYSLWPKGLQWRCVTWVGFGSFLFNRSVWSVGSLWSGNQLLTPLGNTFFSSRHFCPRWNMLVVPFLLEAATQVFDTLSVQLKSAPRLPVLQQGECNRQRDGETKKTELCSTRIYLGFLPPARKRHHF